MNILMLGGSGYLGTNIVKVLSNENNNIFCVIRRTSDIKYLKMFSNVKFIANDIGQIDLTLQQEKIDWVFNGVGSYRSNSFKYEEMLESNVFFPLNILNLCVKNHIKNFMTIGTALPKNFNMYSFTKSKFADFGEFFCDNEEINFVNLNVEMFYGGFNEPDNRFIKSCALKLIQNIDLDLTIGTQKRDIIHMEDVTHLISALMNTNYIKGYRSLDVGSGINHSVREIIEFMKQEMNSCSRLNYGVIQSRVGEPSTVANIDWYKDINYQMKYSYYEGLKNECKIIQNYYLNHLV